MNLTSIYSYGYKTTNIVEYALHIDFVYTITKVEGRQVSISVVDNSIYTDSATPKKYYWLIKKGSTVLYEGYDSSFNFTFELTRSLEVRYQITTKYGISQLDRVLYFNTYPTINTLLARTTTAISKAYNGNNYKLLSLDADEYDMIYASSRDVMKTGYIKWATGIALDYLAVLWNIYRDDDESDDEFRVRIIQTITSENVQITKSGLLSLICASYGLEESGVELVEREDLPDYSWGAETYGDDLLPYDNSVRPAEFTYYLLDGPINPTNTEYLNKMINQTRACGVYFNSPKVTIVADMEANPLDITLEEFTIYDVIPIDGDGGWGDMSWGTKGEIFMQDILNPSHIYTEIGKWVIILAAGGDNSGYMEKVIEVFESTEPRWGIIGWGSLW